MNYFHQANIRKLDIYHLRLKGQVLTRVRERRKYLSVGSHLYRWSWTYPDLRQYTQCSDPQIVPFPTIISFPTFVFSLSYLFSYNKDIGTSMTVALAFDLRREGKWDVYSGNLLLPMWAAWLKSFQVLLIKINCPGRLCQRKLQGSRPTGVWRLMCSGLL